MRAVDVFVISVTARAASFTLHNTLSLHGALLILVVVFGAVMPATVGLANWTIPHQSGRPDRALPRMNSVSSWLPVAAFSLLMLLGTKGRQYSLPELRGFLEAAGFVDVESSLNGGGYYSLVVARKPATG